MKTRQKEIEAAFCEMLPKIERHIMWRLRNMNGHLVDKEAIVDQCAGWAFVDYARMIQTGKEGSAFWSCLAKRAWHRFWRQYNRLHKTETCETDLADWKGGNDENGKRRSSEMTLDHAKRKPEPQMSALGGGNTRCARSAWKSDRACIPSLANWLDWLQPDGRLNPAEAAALMIDVQEYFDSLPSHYRRIAESFARGESPGFIAQKMGYQLANVGKIRRQLLRLWRERMPQDS